MTILKKLKLYRNMGKYEAVVNIKSVVKNEDCGKYEVCCK
jgi:hypothetical protein